LTDKYSGYDSSIALILRGFDEWVATYKESRYFNDYDSKFILGLETAQAKILFLASYAQREVDEARAAK
jgi:hypothetical protein